MNDTGRPALIHIDLISLLPVILCLAAGIIGYFLVDTLHLNAATLQSKETALDSAISLIPTEAAHAHARYGVAAAFIFLLAATFVSVGQSLLIIWSSFSSDQRFRFLDFLGPARFIAGFSAISGGLLFWYGVTNTGELMREKFIAPVFEKTLALCAFTGCVTPDADGKAVSPADNFQALFDMITMAGNGFAAVATALMAVGASCLLIQARNTMKEKTKEELDIAYSALSTKWKSYLYCSSIFLVAGVFVIAIPRSWPAAYMIPDNDLTATFQAFVDGSVLVHSLIYSITLFAIFFSCSTLLNLTYRSHPETSSTSATDAPFQNFHSFFKSLDGFKAVFAVLAPFLSGILPGLVDALK